MEESISGQLKTLLAQLKKMGSEQYTMLLSLTEIVEPYLSPNDRSMLLVEMFDNVSQVLNSAPEGQISQYAANPPRGDFPAFCMLLQLHKVYTVLSNIPSVQLFCLTDSHIPPTGGKERLDFFKTIQGVFSTWSNMKIRQYHDKLVAIPIHSQRQEFLNFCNNAPTQTVNLLLALLKSDTASFIPFKNWLENLDDEKLVILINLLEMQPVALLDLRMRMGIKDDLLEEDGETTRGIKREWSGEPKMELHTSTGGYGFSSASYQDENAEFMPPTKQAKIGDSLSLTNYVPMPSRPLENSGWGGYYDIQSDWGKSSTDQLIVGAEPPSNLFASTLDQSRGNYGYGTDMMGNNPIQEEYPHNAVAHVDPNQPEFHFSPLMSAPHLKIAKQPPAKTVYQRILKPYPSVVLSGVIAENDSRNNLFVEATLIRGDSEVELPLCLDGTKMERITGSMAVFKKLKVMVTSQQQATLFRLKFQLKRYVDNTFENLQMASIISNPIEVFSHTQYLTTKRGSTPTPPSISEIIPARGQAHSRTVILGANFIQSPSLRAKFNDVIVNCEFYEAGTVICHVPHIEGASQVLVSVSNDGVDFCQSNICFYYA